MKHLLRNQLIANFFSQTFPPRKIRVAPDFFSTCFPKTQGHFTTQENPFLRPVAISGNHRTGKWVTVYKCKFKVSVGYLKCYHASAKPRRKNCDRRPRDIHKVSPGVDYLDLKSSKGWFYLAIYLFGEEFVKEASNLTTLTFPKRFKMLPTPNLD